VGETGKKQANHVVVKAKKKPSKIFSVFAESERKGLLSRVSQSSGEGN